MLDAHPRRVDTGTVESEKGKPVERRGRKATGLKERAPTTAGLPRIPRHCACFSSSPHSEGVRKKGVAHATGGSFRDGTGSGNEHESTSTHGSR